ncbi:cytochrome b561 domain-containing protein 1 isoform X4 [Trachypithecus francoisi]|uniref:cytochrome b561 domain-containing protein 1 isoform X4 n=1 Tax=Trachypithecus francoisi TaxID=54180 RepID=UPI00141B158A|nr:cytochrome b561 domain-containing protein 1 isoform X4 [Trachypithecus francoisi]
MKVGRELFGPLLPPGSRGSGPLRGTRASPPPPEGAVGHSVALPAASRGRSLSCSRRRLRDRKPGRRVRAAGVCEPAGHGHAALGGLFSWHPVFMSLAFCLCMAEAILLFSPEHSPFFFCSRKARIRLHWAGQTLAILCAALGLGFIISSRTRSELPHLVSWHSWVGALTLLATGVQALCGLCLLCPRAARVSRVARLKLYHLTCGLVVYLMATVTVLLGMYSVWFQAQIKGAAWYLCLALPVYPALVIMHQISRSYLPRKKMEM